MNIVEKLSKELPLLERIDTLKNELDTHRPLSKQLSDRVFQKLRLDWNYNSNAIEGNSFTYGETIALLMEGITAKGKPLKDALDIKGHNDAIDFMMDMVKNERDLNESDIRGLHKLVLGNDYYSNAVTADGLKTKKIIKAGRYKTSSNHVQTSTGEIHYYATPEETPAKMKELVEWYNDVLKNDKFHPLVLASVFHHRFVAIHPFDDGNGRMTRILTNFILLKFGYPVSVIKQETKRIYYANLSQADNGQIIPIVEYLSESVEDSLKIYLKAIAGEDISEPDDLDKEIALFRKKIGFKTEIKKFKETSSTLSISFETFSFLREKLDKFSDLFYTKSEILSIQEPKNVNLNGITFFSQEKKDKDLIEEKFLKANSVIYRYNYNRNIHYPDNNINIQLKIHFKKENYIIYFNQEQVIKYYDEKIIDYKYKDLVKNIINYVMDEIKNNNS